MITNCNHQFTQHCHTPLPTSQLLNRTASLPLKLSIFIHKMYSNLTRYSITGSFPYMCHSRFDFPVASLPFKLVKTHCTKFDFISMSNNGSSLNMPKKKRSESTPMERIISENDDLKYSLFLTQCYLRVQNAWTIMKNKW